MVLPEPPPVLFFKTLSIFRECNSTLRATTRSTHQSVILFFTFHQRLHEEKDQSTCCLFHFAITEIVSETSLFLYSILIHYSCNVTLNTQRNTLVIKCTKLLLQFVDDKTEFAKKKKKFSENCYFELCFYQTLFSYDLSQKISFTGKEIPANNCKQLSYPEGLGEKFKGG